MKKIFIISTLVAVLMGCVKDPVESLNTNLFSVRIGASDFISASIIADNSVRYKVEIEALKDIDNDKQITVSVSDGAISAASNLTSSSTSNLITLVLQGKKAVFYYKPGKKPQNSAALSITISGLTQVFDFSILASEPEQLFLSATPAVPPANTPVNLTASLIKDANTNRLVSDNLKVLFKVAPDASAPANEIQAYLPDPSWAFSSLDESTGFVTAKKTFTTNQIKGKVVATASYTKSDGTVKSATCAIQFN